MLCSTFPASLPSSLPLSLPQVDISFSSDSGLKSARYMLEKMEAMPPLRPLILVLKYFLVGKERGREGGRRGWRSFFW
jgi:hypothetical protein